MNLYSAFGNQSGHCDVKSAKKVRQFQRNVRLREILTRKIFGRVEKTFDIAHQGEKRGADEPAAVHVRKQSIAQHHLKVVIETSNAYKHQQLHKIQSYIT